MNLYYYTLIRNIPNPARCEPVNSGLILQSALAIQVKFYQRRDRDVSYDWHSRWQSFFTEQVNIYKEDEYRSFPIDFRCYADYNDSVSVTCPLVVTTTEDFESAFTRLFKELILP